MNDMKQTASEGVASTGVTGSDTTELTVVFGALRSGSTVFRLMLNAHPMIQNPGEFDFLFDHLVRRNDGSWTYDVTELERDWIYVGAPCALPEGFDEQTGDGIAALRHMLDELRGGLPGAFTINLHRNLQVAAEVLPGLKVIRLLRDPRDVARSAMGMGWAGTLWRGAEAWEAAEDAWDAAEPLLAPDHVLTLRYEDLIADFEPHLREVCAFLGQPWDPAMLTYYEGTTYSAPDPKLIEQWRHRSTPKELSLIEYRLGDRLTSRGYAPSGHTPRPPSALEKIGLKVQDVLGRWKYGVNEHGAYLYFGEKITRAFGLKRQNDRFVALLGDSNREKVK